MSKRRVISKVLRVLQKLTLDLSCNLQKSTISFIIIIILLTNVYNCDIVWFFHWNRMQLFFSATLFPCLFCHSWIWPIRTPFEISSGAFMGYFNTYKLNYSNPTNSIFSAFILHTCGRPFALATLFLLNFPMDRGCLWCKQTIKQVKEIIWNLIGKI